MKQRFELTDEETKLINETGYAEYSLLELFTNPEGLMKKKNEKQVKVNQLWKDMGEKYRFDWLTVQGEEEFNGVFFAEPLPPDHQEDSILCTVLKGFVSINEYPAPIEEEILVYNIAYVSTTNKSGTTLGLLDSKNKWHICFFCKNCDSFHDSEMFLDFLPTHWSYKPTLDESK